MVCYKHFHCLLHGCPSCRWLPETGGANLPALNKMLKPLGIALGDTVLEGNYELGEHTIYYASGNKND